MSEQCNVISKVKVCQRIVYPFDTKVRTVHLLAHDEVNENNKEGRGHEAPLTYTCLHNEHVCVAMVGLDATTCDAVERSKNV